MLLKITNLSLMFLDITKVNIVFLNNCVKLVAFEIYQW